MRIDRIHHPDQAHASGFFAPLIRVSAHLGYSARQAEAATEDSWEEDRTHILNDLEEALEHMSVWAGHNAFLDAESIRRFNEARHSLTEFLEATTENKETTLNNIQNLLHNLAYVSARLEHDAAGTEASEGREL